MRTLALTLFCAGFMGGFVVFVGGCSVDPLTEVDVATFQTLTVAYGDPGLSADPCNDALPILDGLGSAQEWSDAEPLFVRMTGENGSGGDEFFLEIRALWTDESRLGGTDRVYFMVRYADNDRDQLPDQLAYATRNPVTGELIAGPVVLDTLECDGRLSGPHMDPANWTRMNQDGREDQVLLLLTRVDSPTQPSNLIEVNQALLPNVGLVPPTDLMTAGRDVDVWVWRAGRTNLHPVPQYANWTSLEGDYVPEAAFSKFLFRAGFAEDLWVDGTGRLETDLGRSPYVRNFGDRNLTPIPDQMHACPPSGRDPTDEELAAINRGLPNDQALWEGTTDLGGSVFMECKKMRACSRVGRPDNWSRGLVPGEVDYVQGWRLRVPYDLADREATSARDVRARGAYETVQEKGFPVWTLEMMRDMDTGNPDDLIIDPGEGVGVYRIVIGVLDDSGTIGSGSTEIYLRFEAPKSKIGRVNRC